MELTFKPLEHAPWIDNAIIPVNKKKHFQISVSKGQGPWYTGEDESYEAAIQVIDFDRYPNASLVLLLFNEIIENNSCN